MASKFACLVLVRDFVLKLFIAKKSSPSTKFYFSIYVRTIYHIIVLLIIFTSYQFIKINVFLSKLYVNKTYRKYPADRCRYNGAVIFVLINFEIELENKKKKN